MGEGSHTSHGDVSEIVRSTNASYSSWSSLCQSLSGLVLLAESELTPFLVHDAHISKDLFANYEVVYNRSHLSDLGKKIVCFSPFPLPLLAKHQQFLRGLLSLWPELDKDKAWNRNFGVHLNSGLSPASPSQRKALAFVGWIGH